MKGKKVLVTGSSGFIGTHLVKELKARGAWVRGVDITNPRYLPQVADQFIRLDLRLPSDAFMAFATGQSQRMMAFDYVFDLAADMGGMGHILSHHASIATHNNQINTNVSGGVRKWCPDATYVYTSSACAYPDYRQLDADSTPLREEEVLPADPQGGYGWQKLFHEQVLGYYRDSGEMDVQIVRFHNAYGPYAKYEGGREKVIAALCRKVIEAKAENRHDIEIWGDGEQVRSFMYASDTVTGLLLVALQGDGHPTNVGSEDAVTINALADVVSNVAGWPIKKKHVPGPQGVRGRNSDSTKVKKLGWTQQVSLLDGVERTYRWIKKQLV